MIPMGSSSQGTLVNYYITYSFPSWIRKDSVAATEIWLKVKVLSIAVAHF